MRRVRIERQHSDVHLDECKAGDILTAMDLSGRRLLIQCVLGEWYTFYPAMVNEKFFPHADVCLRSLIAKLKLLDIGLCDDMKEAEDWVYEKFLKVLKPKICGVKGCIHVPGESGYCERHLRSEAASGTLNAIQTAEYICEAPNCEEFTKGKTKRCLLHELTSV